MTKPQASDKNFLRRSEFSTGDVSIGRKKKIVPLINDTNPPPQQIDQFAPYLTRKLSLNRALTSHKVKRSLSPLQDGKTQTFLTSRPLQSLAQTTTSNVVPLIQSTLDSELSFKTQNSDTSITYSNEWEHLFDSIAVGCLDKPLYELVETSLKNYFKAKYCNFFHDIPSIGVLYCPSTAQSTPHGSGLVGFCQFSRKVINLDIASSSVSYSDQYDSKFCEANSRVLLFPLFDSQETTRAVIQVVRDSEDDVFSSENLRFVEYFQMKFRQYARYILQCIVTDDIMVDLCKSKRLKEFIPDLSSKIESIFNCKSVDLFSYEDDKFVTHYSTAPKTMSVFDSGIVGFSLKNCATVSLTSCSLHSSYSPEVDGPPEQSVLSMPIRADKTLYGIVLRGKKAPHFFTDFDEKLLIKISPLIIQSLNNALMVDSNFKKLDTALIAQERITKLLEVAKALSGTLDLEDLTPNIMTRACELLKADRCSLFMVVDDHLVSAFSRGLDQKITIPINAGIVGYCATTGQTVNIMNAYEDPRFNRSTDIKTGYRTKTILCAPIKDDNGKVSGVTQIINKIDGYFTKDDQNLLEAFNIFAAVSLANAKLYKASIDLSHQLKSVLELNTAVSTGSPISNIKSVLKNARTVLKAKKASVYIGADLNIIADDEDNVDKASKKINKAMELILGQVVQSKVDEKNEAFVRKVSNGCSYIENNMAGCPIFVSKPSVGQKIPGSIEKSFNTKNDVQIIKHCVGCLIAEGNEFQVNDLKLLESFAVFVSIIIEHETSSNNLTEVEKSSNKVPKRFLSSPPFGYLSVLQYYTDITEAMNISIGKLYNAAKQAEERSGNQFHLALNSIKRASELTTFNPDEKFAILSSLLFSRTIDITKRDYISDLLGENSEGKTKLAIAASVMSTPNNEFIPSSLWSKFTQCLMATDPSMVDVTDKCALTTKVLFLYESVVQFGGLNNTVTKYRKIGIENPKSCITNSFKVGMNTVDELIPLCKEVLAIIDRSQH